MGGKMEIKQVSYEKEELEKRAEEGLQKPENRESLESSCIPITTCCPDTGWH